MLYQILNEIISFENELYDVIKCSNRERSKKIAQLNITTQTQ